MMNQRESHETEYQYVAWFRGTNLPPDEQDQEWCACFYVSGPSPEEALKWGNDVSAGYVARNPDQRFLNSYLDPDSWRNLNLDEEAPHVTFGVEPAGDEIGW